MKIHNYFFPHVCLCGCGTIIWGEKQFVHTHHIRLKNPFTGVHRFGSDNPNFGNKWTEEQKIRSRNRMIGMYDGKNNYFFGKRYVGDKNPFWGRHHTPEAKLKLSIAKTGKLVGDRNPAKRPDIRMVLSNQKKGINNPMYGQKGIDCPAFGKRGKLSPSYGKPPAHSKRIYYESPLQGTVCFRSSWEYGYARYLDSIPELWYYEIDTYELLDEKTYTPDFYLPRLNKFIEIKGRIWNKDGLKCNQFKEEYPIDINILFADDLINLGIEV